MSQRTITVRFFDRQGCEDLYKNYETNRVYARQASNVKGEVFWYTTTKWRGGYESSCHVKAGITFRAVDSSGNILFEETVLASDYGNYAVKKGDFLSDATKCTAQKYKDALHLIAHEEWRTQMAKAKDRYGYSGMMDNWVYCEHTTTSRSCIDTVMILGKEKYIIIEKCKHNLCSLEWFAVTVSSTLGETTDAICGYQFLTA